MSHNMKYLIIILSLLSSPSFACVPWEHGIEQATAARDKIPDSVLKTYGVPDAQKILDAINKIDPVTDYKSDKFMVLVMDDQVKFGFEQDSCMIGPFSTTLDQWNAILSQAL